jgi:hypothetical protein
MGARAYVLIDEFEPLDGDSVVEIGSERGEGSTAYFRKYCEDKHLPFYSVDVDPLIENVIKSDGAEWLEAFEGTIGFAYLDNFDYIFEHIAGKEWVQRQIENYAKRGVTMNNENSERAHLEQAKHIARLSRIGTVVIFDDTWFDNGYHGKGAKAVPYLLGKGFQLVNEVDSIPESYVQLRRIQ